MFKLQFLDNRQPALWLVDQRLTLGRDKGNGLVIDDEGVSLFHAELRQEDGRLFVWDSGSVNGTFLNGEKVAQKAEVRAGDVLRFHLVEVLVTDPSKGVVQPPPSPVKRDIEKPVLPRWQLKAMTGATSGKMYLIDGTTVLGRDPGCDILISGPHVSRRHAEISIRSGQLWMQDLGSSNGSFLNGKRTEESVLHHGDEVKFDAVTFKVVGPAQPVDTVDEADMTQFRPVLVPKPAPAPAAPAPAPAPAAPQPAPVQAAPVAPEPPPVAPAPAATSSPSPEAPASGLGPVVLLVLVVLVVLAGIVLVVF